MWARNDQIYAEAESNETELSIFITEVDSLASPGQSIFFNPLKIKIIIVYLQPAILCCGR